MGAMKNMVVQFGMINAQVAMSKATNDPSGLSLNMTHNCTDQKTGQPKGVLHPINQKIVCSGCGQELTRNQTTRAFQPSKGTYVEITDAELESIKIPTNGTIIIEQIVAPTAIMENPTWFDGSTYFLTPPTKDKYPPSSFALILAMLGTDVAIARTAMYNKEHTCLLRAGQNGAIIMDLLRYPTELRQEPQVSLPALDPSWIQMATAFKENMRQATPNLNYTDHFGEAFGKLKEAKMAGLPLAQPAAAPAPVAQDSIKKQLEAMLAMGKPQPTVTAEMPAVEVQAEPKTAKKGKKKGKAA